MARPERYQLPLLVELGGQPADDPTLMARAAFDRLYPGQEGQSRFVRLVQEEVLIRSPADAALHLLNRVYTPFDQFDQEELWTLLLNTKNRVTHEVMVYRGTLNTIQVRLAEVFKEAIRVNAASLLLSHCHPSGEPTPSPQDIQLTEQVIQVGELLSIPLLDHLVIGQNQWLSMKERGLAFPR
ncbi:MAG TPA: JAB domain-containing protein [Anaerolineales bacterium]